MRDRVLTLLKKLPQIEEALSDPDVARNPKRFKELNREHSYLSQLKESWELLERAQSQQEGSRELLRSSGDDAEMRALAEEELAQLTAEESELTKKVANLLVPPDPRDDRPILLELRAGTGGDEAALFVGDCARMYRMYADKKGWSCELLSCAPGSMGGFKEYVIGMSGAGVFRMLQYEAGTHRVQRVPETEAQGRVHTSAITVAVLLEPDEEEDVQIDEKELRIDTYRSSGAGGQHVNTTDSAVRITHLPTGTVVYCQEERSQHKNKDKAMRLLKAKIAEERRIAQQKELSNLRASQVGSGDRSERIRTYNFPQNRLTDHRIGLTIYSLDRVMEGDLDEIAQALVTHFYQEKLTGSSSA